jgi:hypothetical protein
MTAPTADGPGKDQTWTTEGGCEVDKNYGAPGWETALDTSRSLFAPWSIPAYKKNAETMARKTMRTRQRNLVSLRVPPISHRVDASLCQPRLL